MLVFYLASTPILYTEVVAGPHDGDVVSIAGHTWRVASVDERIAWAVHAGPA